MVREYWSRICARAWGDTLLAFGLTSRQRAVTQVLVALIAVALVGYLGGADDLKSKTLTGLATAGAVSLVFAAMYLWNLLVVPAKIDSEINDKFASLQRKFDEESKVKITKEERQQAVDDLAEEIRWATNNLLNPNPHPLASGPGNITERIDAWKAQCNLWFEKISKKLDNRKFFTRAQQLHFDILAVVDQDSTLGNPHFNHGFNILSTKIKRLRDIMEQVSRAY
jgi:hypothetical protein